MAVPTLDELLDQGAQALIEQYDGTYLRDTIMTLGGHDMQMVCEAFDRASRVQGRPVAILAYTIKGYGLPLAGHKDNHSGLLNEREIETLRESFNVPEGQEFERLAGLSRSEDLEAYLDGARLHRRNLPRPSTRPRRRPSRPGSPGRPHRRRSLRCRPRSPHRQGMQPALPSIPCSSVSLQSWSFSLVVSVE